MGRLVEHRGLDEGWMSRRLSYFLALGSSEQSSGSCVVSKPHLPTELSEKLAARLTKNWNSILILFY